MPLRQLYPAEDVDESQVDIIAVHGLNPRSKSDEEHAWDTWRKPAGGSGRLWLQTDLPEKHTTQARIFLWVYNSTLVYGRDRGQFIDKANDLLEALRIERRKDPDRPLIFLAHSLGGILVQQALVNAHNNAKYTPIRNSTTGLVFFGTPHDGGNKTLVALGSAAARVASTLLLQPSNDVIETLKSGSLFTDLLGEQWRHQLESYQLISFWEGIGNIVPKRSATFGLSGTRENIVELNAEHSDLCRFDESRRDKDNFKLVANNIQDLYEIALERTHNSLANCAELQQGRETFQLVFSLATAPEIDYFVGRASSLSSIESRLLPFTAAERKVVVLHGLGGIGKSQLAIEFANKHRLDYTAVFWLNAKTEDTLKRSFAANARRLPNKHLSQDLLDGPQNEEALRTILHEMKTWLGLPGNDRWLLIYDNVDNPKIPDNKSEGAYDIRSYFPKAHQGSILVTTRWKPLRIGYPIEVAKLSEDEESISLLVQISGRAIGEDLEIKSLLRKLDGLPIALATAGGYLGQTGISISKYLHHLETSWLELQRTSPTPLSYETQTIYSTWNLSYMHIRREDNSAAKFLELWAYFDNRDLWYDLLKAGKHKAPGWFLDVVSTELAFYSVIGKLQKHALIERLTESDGYSMHHCVHSWVKSVLCKTVEDQNMRIALTCVGKSIPVVAAPGDWIIKQRLFPHSERSLHLLHEWSDESKDFEAIKDCFVQFSDHLGNLFYDLGKLREAVSLSQWALAIKEEALGRDHTSTFDTVNNLGVFYQDQDKLTEAESMYQRALIGKEQALGRDHNSTLRMVHNLGTLYQDQGKLTKAESMYQRALTGYEKSLEHDPISMLKTINSLGILYHDQGKLTKAESMYQRALTGYEKVLKHDHIATLQAVNSLGTLYHDQGELTKAESMYQRALTGYEKVLGHDHISTLETLNNVGVLYHDQGKLTEAESIYQRALAGYSRNPPSNAKSQPNLFYNMGLLSRELQNFERVKGFFNQAHEGYQKRLGSQHAKTIDALDQLNIEIERNMEGAEGSDRQGESMEKD